MSTSTPHQPEPNPYAPPASAVEAPLAWTSEPVIEALRQTRPWVLFLSIVGFIITAIVAAAGLLQVTMSLVQPTPRTAGEAIGGAMFTLLAGILYFFPSLYLLRFSGRIRDLTYSHRLADLEAALGAQKSFWRFSGILVALLLALYAVIIVGAAVMGSLAALRT